MVWGQCTSRAIGELVRAIGRLAERVIVEQNGYCLNHTEAMMEAGKASLKILSLDLVLGSEPKWVCNFLVHTIPRMTALKELSLTLSHGLIRHSVKSGLFQAFNQNCGVKDLDLKDEAKTFTEQEKSRLKKYGRRNKTLRRLPETTESDSLVPTVDLPFFFGGPQRSCKAQ